MAYPEMQPLIESYGKTIELTITHGDTVWTGENIVSCNISTEGEMFTAVMQQAEIELDGVGDAEFAESMKGERVNISLFVNSESVEPRRIYAVHNTTLTFTTELSACSVGTANIIPDKEYVVTWAGKSYTCTAQRYDASICLGNVALFGGSPNTGEPFVIEAITANGSYVYKNTSTAETISFSISYYESGATRNFGTFIVKDSEYHDDTNSVTLICYDLMLPAMEAYVPVVEFTNEAGERVDIRIGDFLQAICDHMNVPLATPSFLHSGMLMAEEKYIETGSNARSQYTFRDVLTEIAQAAAGTIAIKNDALHVLHERDSGITITPDNLKSLKIGEKFGAVNSLVLAREPQEDNIYRRDETVTEWTEIRFADNQLIDAERDLYIDLLYSSIAGLEYYTYEIESFGVCCLELCEFFTLQALDGTEYRCLWMGSDLEITQGISESSRIDLPKSTTTDYALADTTDRRINQTILRVDKQDQRIEALVSTTKEKTNELTGAVEILKQEVSATMTADAIRILVSETLEGIDSITTSTGYTFGANGLVINKDGEEITNRLDHTGMYVDRNDTNILTANAEGVNALNLTARQFLIIGSNARFEDYEGNRTGCFYIGEEG